MFSLPIHRPDISVLPQSMKLFSRLSSVLLPLARHSPRRWPWLLHRNCPEDTLAVWQALCFHMKFTPCPHLPSCDRRSCLQEPPALDEKQWFFVSWSLPGVVESCQPNSATYQPKDGKSGSDTVLFLLQASSIFTLRGCVIFPPSPAPPPPPQHHAVSWGAGAQASLPPKVPSGFLGTNFRSFVEETHSPWEPGMLGLERTLKIMLSYPLPQSGATYPCA